MKDKEINEIKEEIQESDAALFKKADINRLNTLESQIEKGFRKAPDAYFSIGSALWTIHRNGYYRINGFKNIADYAYERFELSNLHLITISVLLTDSRILMGEESWASRKSSGRLTAASLWPC